MLTLIMTNDVIFNGHSNKNNDYTTMTLGREFHETTREVTRNCEDKVRLLYTRVSFLKLMYYTNKLLNLIKF